MKKPRYFDLPPHFTDYVGIETIRNANLYREHGVEDTFTIHLVINGEDIPITQQQAEALQRNYKENKAAEVAKIISKLEAECKCNEDAPFCWAAKAIDLIQKDN